MWNKNNNIFGFPALTLIFCFSAINLESGGVVRAPVHNTVWVNSIAVWGVHNAVWAFISCSFVPVLPCMKFCQCPVPQNIFDIISTLTQPNFIGVG